MKLFLASQGIKPQYKDKYLTLLPKRNNPPKVAWIADAAEPYFAKGPTPWLENSKKQLCDYGLDLVPVHLLDFVGKTDELRKVLEPLDGVWISGGNTHYIRYAMAKSGFDKIIRELLDAGMVYGGESAGAMVAGPNIELSEDEEELKDVPEIIEDGLGLYSKLILPHWDVPEYKESLQEIDKHHKEKGSDTVFLTNDDAVIIDE